MRFWGLRFVSSPGTNFIVRLITNRFGTRSATSSPDTAVASIAGAMDGALQILEDSRNSLREPMMHLAASAEALAAMAKAISERAGEVVQPDELKGAIDQLTAKIEQLAQRPVEMQPPHLPAGDELKGAIDQLTAKIEQLGSSNIRPTVALSAELQELHELLNDFK